MVGFGINSYLGFRPIRNHEFYIGGDVGLTISAPGAFLMGIPLLPTAWYQFAMPNNARIRLVAGISLGPTIVMAAGGSAVAGGAVFELLFRPGLLYQLDEDTQIGGDLKFGVWGSGFAFQPQFNWVRSF